ncbi:MAG: N-acetyl-gamma-glutamyl-phosphate reductase [Chloroflexi bacterium]|nr:N-acetyl-gamma-glutamyl-phosphate reductase [Chloroflexota bacterium]
MIQAGIVGGSGYTGGELLRLLHYHPDVEVRQITSREHAGRYIHSAHPHLRDVSRLKFSHPDGLEACDLLFLAMPHGTVARQIDHFAALAPKLIDLSADFRLDCSASYQRWYGEDHPTPRWLDRFVYGLPEVYRDSVTGANYVSGVGCNATVINLALLPLVGAGLLERAAVEIKVGSSEGGNKANAGSHHPIRSGAVRTYKATGHRHKAEVELVLGADAPIDFAVTAIEMVRGVHLLAHCYLSEPQVERDIWKLYRGRYRDEPFVRLVSGKTGLHRLPEPRVVAGSNFCDIGFELDSDGKHLVMVAALDNLGKGAAGSAVQCMNLMFEFDETAGLAFPGLYP